jgi:hypothetical protein
LSTTSITTLKSAHGFLLCFALHFLDLLLHVILSGTLLSLNTKIRQTLPIKNIYDLNLIEDAFLVRVHFSKSADLSQIDTLAVAKSNNFVKGKDQLENIFQDLCFIV